MGIRQVKIVECGASQEADFLQVLQKFGNFMISPTGHGIRHDDKWGRGVYGASRDGGTRIHRGVDFIVSPIGQIVVAPCGGNVIRVKRPYAEPIKGVLFSGLLIQATDFEYTMFYLDPLSEVIRMRVEQGQIIGHAQDISLKYPGMIPHIHMQFDSINPELFLRLP